MEIFLAIAAIFAYMLIIHYAEVFALKNKVFKFIFYLILVSICPILFSYYINGELLGNYEKALRGDYFIYGPTDEQKDAVDKEIQKMELEKQEAVLVEMRSGKTKEDATDIVDDRLSDYHLDRFSKVLSDNQGYNPPRDIILDKIDTMKAARKERVLITAILTTLAYTLIVLMYKKYYRKE